jgi:hypothetical protein
MKPSTFTQAIADEIVQRLSDGEPLAHICRDEGMPAVRTVSDWRKAHSDFEGLFQDARIEGAHAIAQRARMTARGKKAKDGGDSSGDVQRDRLIVDTDLKLLSKWFPHQYGDRLALANDAEAARW